MRNSFGLSLFLTSLVVGVAKTALVTRYLLDPGVASVPVIATVLIVATGMTFVAFALVANLLFRGRHLRGSAEVAGADDLCKEQVVAAYAAQWGLSKAEADVALFVSKGFSNAEIAELRGCAVATIKAQLGSLFRKSGLKTRVQLIALISDEICDQALDRASAQQPERYPEPEPYPVAGPARPGAKRFAAAKATSLTVTTSERIE